MLDVLGFEEQRDSFSYGAYVMATFTKFSVSFGCMPLDNFENYDTSLTEKYRWAASRCRLWAIILGTYGRRHMMANVYDVNLHELGWSKRRFSSRHYWRKKDNAEILSYTEEEKSSTKRRRYDNIEEINCRTKSREEEKNICSRRKWITKYAESKDRR